MKKRLEVVKIGGKVLDKEPVLDAFMQQFASLEGYKILVHGGGKQATSLADRLDIPIRMWNGRRITDPANLDLAVMVYAGLINKKLVAGLQKLNTNALGLTGADMNMICAKRRVHAEIDFGEVGDILPESINIEAIGALLEKNVVPVFCAITHDKKGHLFNTNADTIASTLAVALANDFEVNLTFCFEFNGVLRNSQDPESWIGSLSFTDYQAMVKNKTVSEGMLPKLDNAFQVLKQNVSSVAIKNAESLNSTTGTRLFMDD